MAEEYIVKQGDCLSSIAHRRGMLWETIWNDPRNAALKRERKDPNIIKAGDRLFIRDKELKNYTKSTEQTHEFVKKGTPVKLHLRLMEEVPPDNQPPDEEPAVIDSLHTVTSDVEYNPPTRRDRPCANVPYLIIVDGRMKDGRSDGDGYIKCIIPPAARSARLIIEPGTLRERELPLHLGCLDPLSEISGIKHRLNNLGFACGEINDEVTPALQSALRAFQEKYELPVTGEPDRATRDKLGELHGG